MKTVCGPRNFSSGILFPFFFLFRITFLRVLLLLFRKSWYSKSYNVNIGEWHSGGGLLILVVHNLLGWQLCRPGLNLKVCVFPLGWGGEGNKNLFIYCGKRASWNSITKTTCTFLWTALELGTQSWNLVWKLVFLDQKSVGKTSWVWLDTPNPERISSYLCSVLGTGSLLGL